MRNEFQGQHLGEMVVLAANAPVERLRNERRVRSPAPKKERSPFGVAFLQLVEQFFDILRSFIIYFHQAKALRRCGGPGTFAIPCL